MNAVVTLLKGQVIIPQQIQEMLGIDEGDSFRVEAVRRLKSRLQNAKPACAGYPQSA
ncbi:MAG: hypothetical protein OHK0052_18230 [Anaerolineales bacterium]